MQLLLTGLMECLKIVRWLNDNAKNGIVKGVGSLKILISPWTKDRDLRVLEMDR